MDVDRNFDPWGKDRKRCALTSVRCSPLILAIEIKKYANTKYALCRLCQTLPDLLQPSCKWRCRHSDVFLCFLCQGLCFFPQCRQHAEFKYAELTSGAINDSLQDMTTHIWFLPNIANSQIKELLEQLRKLLSDASQFQEQKFKAMGQTCRNSFFFLDLQNFTVNRGSWSYFRVFWFWFTTGKL